MVQELHFQHILPPRVHTVLVALTCGRSPAWQTGSRALPVSEERRKRVNLKSAAHQLVLCGRNWYFYTGVALALPRTPVLHRGSQAGNPPLLLVFGVPDWCHWYGCGNQTHDTNSDTNCLLSARKIVGMLRLRSHDTPVPKG